jgi:hypothetical protein
VNKNPKDTGSIYLPERYKQKIEAKKRWRLIKKIVIICSIVAVGSVLFLILSGALSYSLNQPPPVIPGSLAAVPEITPTTLSNKSGIPLEQNTTAIRPGDITENKRGTTQPTSDMQSQDNATASLRQDYPASEYSLIRVNGTDLYADRTLYSIKSNR